MITLTILLVTFFSGVTSTEEIRPAQTQLSSNETRVASEPSCSRYSVWPGGQLTFSLSVSSTSGGQQCVRVTSQDNAITVDCTLTVNSGEVRVRSGDVRERCDTSSSPCQFTITRNDSLRINFRSNEQHSYNLQCSASADGNGTPPFPTFPTFPTLPPFPTFPPWFRSKRHTITKRSTCRCGTNPGNRIVGGQNADKNEYPWQVRLNIGCGGTIIDSWHVLTAAHCTDGQEASNLQVFISDHNQFQSDGEVIFSVEKIIQHPDFNRDTVDSDFSILKLTNKIDFSGTNYQAIPACLPITNNQFNNVDATATGWGALGEYSWSPEILQEVDLKTMNNQQCQSSYYYLYSITPNMICASAPGKDTCYGDSGGPLTTKINNQATLIGVTSFGYECAHPFYPGIYARVSAQLDWILDNSGGENCR